MHGNADDSPANVTLTITPDAASKTYGQTLVLNSYSVAGSLIGSDAIGSVSLASAGTAASAGAGTYDITASNAVFSSGSASNYTITYQMLANGLTVNKAALTITANDASKVYDGLAYSGGNGVAYSGFVNGETASVLGGTLAYGGTAQGAVNAGTYSIMGSGLTSGNYNITYAPGALTVSAAALTVTANNASKVYDGLAYSGGNGVSYSGFVNGETASVLGGTLAYGGTAQGAVNAGTYSIMGSGLTSGNYNITYAPGALTVSAAALTVTANNASKVYDGLAYSGGNGVSYSGFVNGETSSVLGGALAYGGTAQGAVNAGTYSIMGSGLTSGNYNITYAPGALTVSAAALTVTANNASKVYDGLAYSGGNGVSYSGFVNGETSSVLGGTLAYGGTAQGAVNAGTYSIMGSGLTSGNYNITYAPGALTVSAAALTVTANNASKVYDGLAYSGGNGVAYSGFVNGETASVLGGTLAYGGTAQGASAAGSYSITASGLTSGNYNITYAPGTLTISPALVTLTITPDAASKTYGQTLVLNSYSVAGSLIGSDAIGSVSLASAGTAASAGAGTYDITASNAVFSSGSAANYAITYQMLANGLTVNKAALTITANDASKVYDGLAYSGGNGVAYSGFVNGETSAVLDGSLVYGGSAQGAVAAGTYDLTVSGLTARNYAIRYLGGVLMVQAAPSPTVTPQPHPQSGTRDRPRYPGKRAGGWYQRAAGEPAGLAPVGDAGRTWGGHQRHGRQRRICWGTSTCLRLRRRVAVRRPLLRRIGPGLCLHRRRGWRRIMQHRTSKKRHHAMRIRCAWGTLIAAGLTLIIPQSVAAQTASQLTEPSYAPPTIRAVRGGLTVPATAGLDAPKGAETLLVTPAGLSVEGGLAPLAAETAAINARLAGKQVSGADLFSAARDLEEAYARAGYLLVRVSLPPQTIMDGQPLKLVVTDGYVEKVDTSSLPPSIRGRLASVLAPLVRQKGLTRRELERRLLLASDLPGVILRSTLTPGGDPGATILVVEGRHDPITGSMSVDNGLSPELGRYPLGVGAEFNSLLGLGEVGYVRLIGYPGLDGALLTDDPRNRQIVGGVTLPLGTDGLWFGLEGVDSRTHPHSDLPYTILDHFQRFSTRSAIAGCAAVLSIQARC